MWSWWNFSYLTPFLNLVRSGVWERVHNASQCQGLCPRHLQIALKILPDAQWEQQEEDSHMSMSIVERDSHVHGNGERDSHVHEHCENRLTCQYMSIVKRDSHVREERG